MKHCVLANKIRRFMINGAYFCGASLPKKFIKNNFVRIFRNSLLLPYAFVRSCLLWNRPLVITQMSASIGTKCTLNCEDCSALMPLYSDSCKKAYMIDTEQVIFQFDRLLEAIDRLFLINIVGGEPFMHSGLGEILEYCINSSKINRIRITTNATLVPSKDIAKQLSHKKVEVYVSNYGDVSKKREELITFCIDENISFRLDDVFYWHKIGNMGKKNRGESELRRAFKNCLIPQCMYFLDGKFHLCTFSAHGMDLGLVPDTPGEYVDVVNNDTDAIRRQMSDLRHNTSYLAACDHCDFSKIYQHSKITAGLQPQSVPEKSIKPQTTTS